MTFQVDFGNTQTDIGYRFYDSAGAFLGARVTAGISPAPQTGVYLASAALPAGAFAVYWDCADPDFAASEETRYFLLEKLNLGAPEDPIIPIVAPAQAGQAVGYVVTRDGSGTPISGVPIFFQLLAAPGLDSYSTAPFRIASADQVVGLDTNVGVLQHAFQRAASYRAKRAPFEPPLSESPAQDKWVSFTVPDTADPFPLPQILGTG